MSAGAIPVFIGRDLVPPFREQFDWGAFSLMFEPHQVGPAMLGTLRAITPETLQEMQVSTRRGAMNATWYLKTAVSGWDDCKISPETLFCTQKWISRPWV